jgi:hypothetical protein
VGGQGEVVGENEKMSGGDDCGKSIRQPVDRKQSVVNQCIQLQRLEISTSVDLMMFQSGIRRTRNKIRNLAHPTMNMKLRESSILQLSLGLPTLTR